MPDPSPSTLIVLPNNLGDVIMATPVLEGLRTAEPGSRCFFLVEEGFDGGLAGNPYCDEVIPIPRKFIRETLWSERWEEGLRSLQGLVDGLSSRGFSRIINLCQHDYIPYLVAAIKAPVRLGRQFLRAGNHALPDDWSQYLYAIPFARRFNGLHATDVYRRIAGVTAHRGGYTIKLTTEEIVAAREFLASRLGSLPDRARTIVFQPGAAYASKRWPADHFVALGGRLIADGWTVVVAGAPAEVDLALAIGGRLGQGSVVAAGDTSFRQSIGLLTQACGCVTGDTALMHAAAALDVPVYAVFGPTSPVETGPYGNGHWIFAGGCAQRPCFCFGCKTQLCMKSILPETVRACIVAGAPPPSPGCDIYRTRLAPAGDYALEPVSAGAYSYVNVSGAAMTRRALGDPGAGGSGADADEARENAAETRRAAEIAGSMQRCLEEFLRTRRAESIRRFEDLKTDLAALQGIGAFWTALLNLRLNSVTVLDPMQGVKGSIVACARTESQLRAAT